jgi:hypothetical protein
MNFAEAIVSRFGTQPKPFVWSDILTVFLIFLALGLIAAIEFLIGQAVRRVAASAWRAISREFDRANRKDQNGS